MNEFKKFGTGPSTDETRIEQIGPSTDETRVESKTTAIIEQWAEKYKNIMNDGDGLKVFTEELNAINLEKEKLIEEVKDFNELFQVLDRINNLNNIYPGLGLIKTYDIPNLIDIINRVRGSKDLEEDIKNVTKTAGLRNKVYELIINERNR